MNARQASWQGMNWIRQEKRLAIYLRDGLACVWCGASTEAGAQLTLDHLTPHCQGGSNGEANLITCCKACNDSRGARSIKTFAKVVAEYRNHGLEPKAILAHIKTCTKRELKPFLTEAKQLIAQRGSCFAVLKGN